MLCYVDHHDPAYDWASRRKIETHPVTGAAQIDDSDLDEVVATERHLLYVACTRARDHLLITSGNTCSEFVEDLLG